MKSRLLVAGVGVPLLLLVLLACPPWATLILVCFIAAVAAYEMLHTAGSNVPLAAYVLTILAALVQELGIFTGSDAFAIGSVGSVTVVRWAFVMLLFIMAVLTYGKKDSLGFRNLCIAVVAGIVLLAMYSCIFRLRQHETFGRVYVLAPFCVAFIGDTFSMFGGMLFGKRKMAPLVSPKKTWAGGVGGLVGGALGLVLLGLVSHFIWNYDPNYGMLILAGAVANIFGQFGDLSMSLIKREVGIKDYSHLFLEHGGMLDRFDSTMFIAPVLWFFVCGGLL